LMIATLAVRQALRVSSDDRRFVDLCLDVLAAKLKPSGDGMPLPQQRALLEKLIHHFCPPAEHAGRPVRGTRT